MTDGKASKTESTLSPAKTGLGDLIDMLSVFQKIAHIWVDSDSTNTAKAGAEILAVLAKETTKQSLFDHLYSAWEYLDPEDISKAGSSEPAVVSNGEKDAAKSKGAAIDDLVASTAIAVRVVEIWQGEEDTAILGEAIAEYLTEEKTKGFPKPLAQVKAPEPPTADAGSPRASPVPDAARDGKTDQKKEEDETKDRTLELYARVTRTQQTIDAQNTAIAANITAAAAGSAAAITAAATSETASKKVSAAGTAALKRANAGKGKKGRKKRRSK